MVWTTPATPREGNGKYPRKLAAPLPEVILRQAHRSFSRRGGSLRADEGFEGLMEFTAVVVTCELAAPQITAEED